ncbi:MAG: HNH endonuclease [Singulisphaera sp.]
MPRRIPIHKPAHMPSPPRRGLGRAEANRFYRSAAWRGLRDAYLRLHPLCQDCDAAGRASLAVLVHHAKDRRTHPALALDWDNLRSLCKACHNGAHGQRGGGNSLWGFE